MSKPENNKKEFEYTFEELKSFVDNALDRFEKHLDEPSYKQYLKEKEKDPKTIGYKTYCSLHNLEYPTFSSFCAKHNISYNSFIMFKNGKLTEAVTQRFLLQVVEALGYKAELKSEIKYFLNKPI